MSGVPEVIILGAGPAGLGAAWGLALRGIAPVLVERQEMVGGNAGSFNLAGMPVDYGSHRLHPSTDPEILAVLRSLLGPDLRERPRHGRIRLGRRWVHFPLRALDLALRAPPAFLFRALRDALTERGRGRQRTTPESFETVLLQGLGPTICREFFFPYARKIWGLEPSEISPVQAEKRVSARTAGSLLRRLLPGGTGKGGRTSRGTFLYPAQGFGQISEALSHAATEAGAVTLLGTTVQRVRVEAEGLRIQVESASGEGSPGKASGSAQWLSGDHLWSTIPITALARMVEPEPPPEVRHSATQLRQRAMLLVYLVLEQDRFTEFDAHYFPSLDVPFTRVSEPKNYAGRREPLGRTVLCAEIPCSREDPLWALDEAALTERVVEGLAEARLPINSRILESAVRRLPAAYPIYRRGYEAHLRRVEGWLEGLSGVLSFGRQGLFAHDNTHHALFMARCAVRCLEDDGRFDRERWEGFKEIFATHVVED